MSAKPQPPPGGNIDIGWKLEVGTTVTFLSAAIAVTLRCFTRLKYSQRGWDDYLMMFALVRVPRLGVLFVSCKLSHFVTAPGSCRHHLRLCCCE